DPGEAEGQARGVRGALLDLVVGDLDDDLRAHAHRVAVVAGGERLQPGGHRGELDVGEPLEGLAHVGEAVAVTDGQVVVREPAPAPAGPAVGGVDDSVDCSG